jgi:hypothetical protein
MRAVKLFRQSNFFRLLFATLSLSMMGAQCDALKPANNPSLTCTTGLTVIAVYDTFLQTVCNCGGTNGAVVTRGTALSCTFAVGNNVFINYVGSTLRHQIIPVGSPGIPSSPIYDPGDKNAVRSFAFQPSVAGTYQFIDQYDSQLSGSFVVTP